MEHFVTLFDSLFLPQGLALHDSLEKHANDYTLWILCVDEEAYEVLGRLNLPNVRLLKLSEIETLELLRIKGERTKWEYCWTLTPFAPRFVFEADTDVERVTYLDADLWFRKSPSPILKEFESSGKQVLITDHSYAPENDLSATSGQYCVQFMTFTREGGEVVRKWWEENCIEWCFERSEDGKSGDQKYLDDWPERFAEQIHILKYPEWALAPWNASRYPYGNSIFYHFQGLRLLKNRKVNLGVYPLPPVLIKNVYGPYLDCFRQKLDDLQRVDFEPKPQQKHPGFPCSLKTRLMGVYTQLWRFNRRHILSLGYNAKR